MSDHVQLPELITMSAIQIKISNGIVDKQIMLIGNRHYDQLMISQLQKECDFMNLNQPTNSKKWESKRETEVQGFYTNRQRFVDRKEAFVIAHENGQVRRRVGGDKEKLFSENLY